MTDLAPGADVRPLGGTRGGRAWTGNSSQRGAPRWRMGRLWGPIMKSEYDERYLKALSNVVSFVTNEAVVLSV
jgi:hypothetical protein